MGESRKENYLIGIPNNPLVSSSPTSRSDIKRSQACQKTGFSADLPRAMAVIQRVGTGRLANPIMEPRKFATANEWHLRVLGQQARARGKAERVERLQGPCRSILGYA